MTSDIIARLRAALDADQALALFRGAIGRESITGNEANFVDFLEARMRGLDLDGLTRTEFLPGRPNIWGERKGAGGGKRLLFIGHTDTVHVDGWREHWAGTKREDPFAAPIIDGAVWGRISVLRRGKQIGVRETKKTDKNEIIAMITGLQQQ